MSSPTLLFLAIFVAVFCQGWAIFDCRRPNITCGGGTCVGPGCASCPNNAQGYDCSLTAAPVDNTQGACQCQNNGTCYSDAGMMKCFCDQNYYGNKCQIKRSAAYCTWECMTVAVYPHGTPSWIGVSWTDCQLDVINSTNPGPVPGAMGYTFTVCRNQTTTCAQPIDDGLDRWLNVTVQYLENVVTPVDDFILFGCIVAKKQDITVQTGPISVDPKQQVFVGVVDVFNLNQVPVTISIKEVSTGTVVNTVHIGTPIHVELVLGQTSPYKAFKLDGMRSSNVAGNEFNQLVTGGCVNQNSKSFTSRPQRPDQHTIVLPTQAFRVGLNPRLKFTAQITACISILDPACLQSTCTQPAAGARKRRETSDNTQHKVFVIESTEIRITDNNDTNQDNALIMGVLIASGAGAAVIIMSTILIFCVCLRQRRAFQVKKLSPSPSVTSAELDHPKFKY